MILLMRKQKKSMELYSYKKYKGYHLFVERIELDKKNFIFEGVAQYNGNTLYTSKSYISGELAEESLKNQINNSPESD